jgi:amino acid adenylation domain-containing protein
MTTTVAGTTRAHRAGAGAPCESRWVVVLRPPADGGRTSAADDEVCALAALVAVVHRRGAQETVRVGRLDPAGTPLPPLSVEVPGDAAFADLTAQVSAQLAAGGGALAEATLDVVFCSGADPAGKAVLTVPRLAVRYDGAALVGVFAYDSGRYAAAEVLGLANQVRMALVAGSREPDRPVSELNLATDAELATVDGWAGTGEPPCPPAPVHELVARQAAATPGAVAVSCAGSALTYAELEGRAARLAARLVAAGVRTDDTVGVFAERSLELVVGLLAVLKAGGAYAALDSDLPPARLAHLIADTQAAVVLTTADLADRLPGPVTAIPLADQPGDPLPAPVPVEAGNLAYVSYTSGSTGEPKGACVPHAAVSRLIREPDWADFRPDDVFLMLAPVAFDASTLEIWAPLTTGGRLAVAPPGPVDVDALAQTLRTERVTVLWLTAGLFHRMVATHLDAFAGLRHILAGGDVVSPAQVAALLAAHPGLVFTNGYGPTENTTFTACWTSTVPPAGRGVPIGRPISGTRVYVLDPRLRPVPVGVPGELYAAGAGLARGYLRRPGPTAERFLPDPYSALGARMYRTGDLVRWLPDGTLEFLGRADRQIKVQGYRVEPAEVEAAIVARAEVRDAVVVAQADGANGKRLVAYLTPADPDALEPRELARVVRDALREELPGYLVPWAVVPLAALPLNRNGKVDRAALPLASRVARALPYPYVGPRSRLEDDVAALWSDVLGVEPVGVEDDFFELGGHSLIAAEILSGLRRSHGVEITARTLYLRPTVAELAETLGELLPSANAQPHAEKGGQS